MVYSIHPAPELMTAIERHVSPLTLALMVVLYGYRQG